MIVAPCFKSIVNKQSHLLFNIHQDYIPDRFQSTTLRAVMSPKQQNRLSLHAANNCHWKLKLPLPSNGPARRRKVQNDRRQKLSKLVKTNRNSSTNRRFKSIAVKKSDFHIKSTFFKAPHRRQNSSKPGQNSSLKNDCRSTLQSIVAPRCKRSIFAHQKLSELVYFG